jgi:hypothetical protein
VADPVLISNEQPAAGQNAYTLPPNLAFKPTAVTALFDGSASADAFLACLSFYSSSGQLLARQFPDASVGAGEVVEATYAPFLRAAGGGDGAVGSSMWAFGVNGGSIPSETFTQVQYDFFQTNSLGATTADFKSFTVPGIGAKPLFLIQGWFEVANSPACPASDWLIGLAVSEPEGGYANVSGNLLTDYPYPLSMIGLYFGDPGANTVDCTVWHNVLADHQIGRCGLVVTYLGQYQ